MFELLYYNISKNKHEASQIIILNEEFNKIGKCNIMVTLIHVKLTTEQQK